jgi:hypothetical protein
VRKSIIFADVLLVIVFVLDVRQNKHDFAFAGRKKEKDDVGGLSRMNTMGDKSM